METITHFVVFCQYLVTLFKTNPIVSLNFDTNRQKFFGEDEDNDVCDKYTYDLHSAEHYIQKARDLYVIFSQKPMDDYMIIYNLSINNEYIELPDEYICCEFTPCSHDFDTFWNTYLKKINPDDDSDDNSDDK